MILARIQAYQSPRCPIVSRRLLALPEGAPATSGREKVMGLATLGGGLSKQERCRTFPTEHLHAAHLVRIWVTMHVIVLVHTPKQSRIEAADLCGDNVSLYSV